ncbi:MAG: addiction module protein [Sulfuricella sp.]|nr:addiction module protein [Sulfuricella sp.]
MLSTNEIIREAESLPAEELAVVVDALLHFLDRQDAAVDKQWSEIAQRRLAELRSGDVVAIPGEAILSRLQRRFPS